MIKKLTNLRSEAGFTIIELMIALSVLSTILVMATVILIQIGSLYSKGVNAANLQNTNRNIVKDVTSALQFSGNKATSCNPSNANVISCAANDLSRFRKSFNGTDIAIGATCIGTTRYSYVMDSEQGTDSAKNPITGAPADTSIPHVLWRDTIKQNATCQPLDLSRQTVQADSSSADARAGQPSQGYDMVPDHMRLTRFKIEPLSSTGDTYSVDVWMAFGDSDLVNTKPSGQTTCRSTAGTQYCSVSQISSVVAGRAY